MKRNAFWNLIDKAGQRTFVFLSFVNAILGFVFLCAYGEKGVVLSSVDNYEKQYREERIVPPLIERTGIENCLIKQVSFEETHFMIKADPSRYAEITEAVFPLLEKTYERDARFILVSRPVHLLFQLLLICSRRMTRPTRTNGSKRRVMRCTRTKR